MKLAGVAGNVHVKKPICMHKPAPLLSVTYADCLWQALYLSGTTQMRHIPTQHGILCICIHLHPCVIRKFRMNIYLLYVELWPLAEAKKKARFLYVKRILTYDRVECDYILD